MQKIFHIGFIFFLVTVIIRYFISQKLGVLYFDFNSLHEWEMKVYTVSTIWLIAATINLIRRRCPNCNSHHNESTSREELDRWIGTKIVNQKVGKDTYGNVSIPVTKVKIKEYFKCCECSHTWEKIYEEIKH